jgi:hypothetical protein
VNHPTPPPPPAARPPQETSIVDATPGTTADVKAALMELHDIGPAKLFDTAGVDEQGGWRVDRGAREWQACAAAQQAGIAAGRAHSAHLLFSVLDLPLPTTYPHHRPPPSP